jgi:hypothetical protein
MCTTSSPFYVLQFILHAHSLLIIFYFLQFILRVHNLRRPDLNSEEGCV